MKLFTTNKYSNLLVTILQELGVKHTRKFSTDYFEQHPHKNNLFGISQMLTDYDIDNEGLRIKDKAGLINELPTPFIAQVSNDLVVVREISPDNVEYISKEKKIKISISEFLKVWSGITLLTEPGEYSAEPEYKKNRKSEIRKRIARNLLIGVILLLMAIFFVKFQLWTQPGICIALFFNALGLYTCYLLFLKQIHTRSAAADKVCSLFLKKGDCNDILDSNVAKLWGIISLSEVGLAYFASNIIVILFFPFLYPFAAIINICSLPFTIWSIWYQKFQARQWCPLCVIVQVILWILFFVNLAAGLIVIPQITFESILLTGCIYALPLLILKNTVSYFISSKEHRKTTHELNSLKANEDIFKMMLTSKKKHEVKKTDSGILLGNPDSDNLITIITNPHCNPCAKIHKQVMSLIKNASDTYCIQFVFTTFGNSKEDIQKLFITTYLQSNKSLFLGLLDNWYQYGRYNEDRFLKKFPLNCDTHSSDEFTKHKEFINKTGIRSTPTILFNGYEFPLSKYKLNDLVLLKGINIS